MYKIAISGKANSGKNTCGNIIATNLVGTPNAAQFYAFAEPIKKIIQTMFPLANHDELFGSSKLRSRLIPGTEISYRQACLDIGKYGRAYDPFIWIKCFQFHYENFLENHSCQAFIVSDLRFGDEFYHLKNEGFRLIRIVRDQHLKINDISETDQDQIKDSEFDHIINNNGTIDDLKMACAEVCKLIKNK